MLQIATLIICLMLIFFMYKQDMLISSTTMWTGCYIAIYFVVPMIRRYTNSELIEWIALGGIVLYFLGVLIGVLSPSIKIIGIPDFGLGRKIDYRKAKILFLLSLCLVIFTVIIAVGIDGIKMVVSGLLTPIQMLRGQGPVLINRTADNILGWVLWLCACPLFFMIISEDKKKMEKVLALSLYALIIMWVSFSRKYLIYILISIGMYYMSRMKKRKQAICLVFLGVASIFGMIILNQIRTYGLMNPAAVIEGMASLVNSSGEDFFSKLLSNTDFAAGYHYFSQLLEHGEIIVSPFVYLKPLIPFIPRSLWPDKPETLSVQVNNILNPQFKGEHMSSGMGILGEAFVILGYVGFVVYPFLWGLFTSIIDKQQKIRLYSKKMHTYSEALYYSFSILFIFEAHRGNIADPLMFFLWTFVLPALILARNASIKSHKL